MNPRISTALGFHRSQNSESDCLYVLESSTTTLSVKELAFFPLPNTQRSDQQPSWLWLENGRVRSTMRIMRRKSDVFVYFKSIGK